MKSINTQYPEVEQKNQKEKAPDIISKSIFNQSAEW